MTALTMPQAASLAETPPLNPCDRQYRAEAISGRIYDVRNLLVAMDHVQQDRITGYAESAGLPEIVNACDQIASMHVIAVEVLEITVRMADELAALLAPNCAPSGWEAAMTEWQALKANAELFHQTHCAKGEVLSPEVAAQADNLDKLASDMQCELMSMPAPTIAALRFKLDHLLEDDNGSLNPWTDSYVEQTRRDIARLLGEA